MRTDSGQRPSLRYVSDDWAHHGVKASMFGLARALVVSAASGAYRGDHSPSRFVDFGPLAWTSPPLTVGRRVVAIFVFACQNEIRCRPQAHIL
jgi:hypothetical protein